MTRVVIVSYTKYPSDKGGVPLYNSYLQRALLYGESYCYQDFFPGRCDMPEEAKALRLNKRLVQKSIIRRGDIVIGDGVWGSHGIDPRYCKLISVSHGLWRCVRGGNEPIVSIQREGYWKSKVVVACSSSVAKELKFYCDVKSKLILTGLDLNFWHQFEVREKGRPVVLWVVKWKQYPGLDEKVKRKLPKYKHWSISSYDDQINRKLYCKASVFVHLTTNEGNAFAILKSLACNTPVVSTCTGLFRPPPEGCGEGVSPIVTSVVRGIKRVVEHGVSYSPRKWMKDNARLSSFMDQWRKLVSHV